MLEKRNIQMQDVEEEKSRFDVQALKRESTEKDQLISELKRRLSVLKAKKLEFLDERAKSRNSMIWD